MKINDKEFLNPQQQLYQNTKDIEELKEKYKNEIYAVKPFSEWPEDAVLPEVEDPRDFTYVPRSITNVPANAKYGYLLINVENSFEPELSAALLYKIKSVNNSTVYIEFYANVASHVPGPQGETGATPSITATASVNSNVGTPSVTVTKSGTDENPTFSFAFSNLKGEPGQATIGIEVVAELPATGEEGVLYFVPKEDSETGDEYDEYAYVNDDWELLGSAQVDLTNYALKSELPVIDEDLIPKAFNTYVLGDNTHSYKEVVANKFKSPNSYYEMSGVNVSGHGAVTIKTTDGNGTDEGKLQLNNIALYCNKNIAPLSGSTVNLGQAANGFNNLYLDGKIVTDDNLTYGLALPDTTSYTADKTLATTDQIPTLPNYNITNVVTDSSDVLGMQVYNTSAGISYNFYNVNPNPTLAGTESDLTSVDIGGTAYKIPSSNVVIDENIIPKTDSTYTLGDSSHLYDAGYIEKLVLLKNSNAFINAYLNGTTPYIQIRSRDSQSPYNTNTFKITPTHTVINKNLLPDGTIDIGEAYGEFNNLYLKGNIYTDENQYYGILLPDTTSWTSDKTLATAGTSAGDAPVLDANGKLSSSVLPAVAITDTFVVASEAAMLALTAEVGDVAVRTDLNKSFILQTDGASTLSHWQELLTPTDSVTSVNGQTGAVTLAIPDISNCIQKSSTAGLVKNDGTIDTNTYLTSAPVTSVNGHTGSVTITQADLNIVYSATQPSNPTTGTIWIAPAS